MNIRYQCPSCGHVWVSERVSIDNEDCPMCGRTVVWWTTRLSPEPPSEEKIDHTTLATERSELWKNFCMSLVESFRWLLALVVLSACLYMSYLSCTL